MNSKYARTMQSKSEVDMRTVSLSYIAPCIRESLYRKGASASCLCRDREMHTEIARLEKELRLVAAKRDRLDVPALEGQGSIIVASKEEGDLAALSDSVLSLSQEQRELEQAVASLQTERDRTLDKIHEHLQQLHQQELRLGGHTTASSSSADSFPEHRQVHGRHSGYHADALKVAQDDVSKLERQLRAVQRRRGSAAVALEKASVAYAGALGRLR